MVNIKNKKILLVEDNHMHQFMYKFQFEQAGYNNITIAATSQEGLTKIKENKPDLVLLDLVFSGDHGMDGLEVLQKIKAEPTTKDTPIIILSNKRAKDVAEKTKKLGAQDYLLKSDYVPREIVAYVEKYFTNNAPSYD